MNALVAISIVCAVATLKAVWTRVYPPDPPDEPGPAAHPRVHTGSRELPALCYVSAMDNPTLTVSVGNLYATDFVNAGQTYSFVGNYDCTGAGGYVVTNSDGSFVSGNDCAVGCDQTSAAYVWAEYTPLTGHCECLHQNDCNFVRSDFQQLYLWDGLTFQQMMANAAETQAPGTIGGGPAPPGTIGGRPAPPGTIGGGAAPPGTIGASK